MRNPISRNGALFAAGGFVAVLFLAGAAHAITDTVFRYTTPKTGQATIPPSAFLASASSLSWSDNGITLQAPNTGCFSAPVNNLPNGSKPSALAFWYKTNGSSGGSVAFFKVKVSDASATAFAVSAVKVDTADVRTAVNIPIANETIDNQQFFYFIQDCQSATENFFGVRLAYQFNNAGD